MSDETATAENPEPTLEEVQARAEEKRVDRPASSTTSSKAEVVCTVCRERPAERVGEPPFSITIPCPACRQAQAEAGEAEQRDRQLAAIRERRESVVRILETAGVNTRKYGDASLDTFNPDPDRRALERAREFVADYLGGDRPSLYLLSERPGEKLAPGNGKTHLAVAILRELAVDLRVHPSDLRFVFVPELLLEIQDTFDNPQRSMLDVVRKYSEPELLVWDDFGAEKLSDFAVRTLYTVLYKREGRSNVFTSNLTLDAVEGRDAYAERITSRIAGDARLVRLRGPDRRVSRAA